MLLLYIDYNIEKLLISDAGGCPPLVRWAEMRRKLKTDEKPMDEIGCEAGGKLCAYMQETGLDLVIQAGYLRRAAISTVLTVKMLRDSERGDKARLVKKEIRSVEGRGSR